MDSSPEEHRVERFVLELLGTGSMLSELASNLSNALPIDAYPGEDPELVVVEMLCGTIATALAPVDPQDVRLATELIELARARTLEHLMLACALSRRIDGWDGGIGGSDG
jgi:hypothetical protein